MPDHYESYAKVMQPIYVDRSIKDERLLWSECGQDESIDPVYLKKVTYKEMAKKYQLVYSEKICAGIFDRHFNSWPRYIVTCMGELDVDIARKMIGVLNDWTSGECYFFYDILSLRAMEALYYGSLSEGFKLIQKNDAPTFWWVEDRSWCVHTDTDADYCLIGGKKEMIDKLISLTGVEAFEVDRAMRIDHRE